nr:molybdopterin cofactor-binding domain-containing protein [Siminovitchia acidinfaciens]
MIQAIQKESPLVHDNAGQYQKIISNVYPVSGTNIGSHIKIRKGDFIQAWESCEVKMKAEYEFNLSDHAALETRTCSVEINPSGKVIVHSCTQSPYTIKKVLNQFFNLEVGNIIVMFRFLVEHSAGREPFNWSPWLTWLQKWSAGSLSNCNMIVKKI